VHTESFKAAIVFSRAMLPVFLGLVWGGAAPAAPTVANLGNYSMHVWKAEDGLPENTINAALQTRDGYIWLATFAGLVRFDGAAFTVFNSDNAPQLRDNDITSLYEARDGGLWIGHETGELSRYENGRVERRPLPSGAEPGVIRGLAEDATGALWAMNDKGLLTCLRDGKRLAPPEVGPNGLSALARNPAGLLWVCRNGKLSELAGGEMKPVAFPPGAAPNYVAGLCVSLDGGFWAVADGRLLKWKNGVWSTVKQSVPWNWAAVSCLHETHNGFLLAGVGDQGFFAFRPEGPEPPAHYSRTNGFPTDWIICLCDDAEGNWWVGTGGGGIAALRPNRVQTIAPPDQWQGRPVLSVLASRDGSLWMGSEGAGLYHYQDGAWESFGEAQHLHPYVWSLAQDAAGTVWIGTWGAGLFAYASNQLQLVSAAGKLVSPLRAICNDGPGEFWLGCEDGLLHYTNGSEAVLRDFPGEPFRRVRSIVADGHGGIWCGSSGSGLVYFNGPQIRRFQKQDGLASDFIECLHLDKNGALWIGASGSGLTRFKNNRFSVISSRNGLPDSYICHIEEDASGGFWISSHGGIFRVLKSELDACAEGKTNEISALVYGLEDGMPTLTCSGGSQPAGAADHTGKLWFPTVRGLVSIDPHEVKLNAAPPPIIIERILVDDAPAPPTVAGGRLKIPPGRHRLEFRYTALSFVTPERVRFKCRLEGLESQWIDMGTKRAATFSYIPPGAYQFRVIACNSDGVWNTVGADVALSVQPFWWQTWWVRAGAGVALLALGSGSVWFGSRRRMRRRLQESERQRAIELERSRIAQDIHDELGAHLTRITMLAESVRSHVPGPGQVMTGLDRIYDTASQLTRAMDETVWAVNPKHDSLEGFANYVENFALDFLGAAGIACQLDFPESFPPLPLTSEVRHHVFLAFKEALNNVAKHSGATQANITLRAGADFFELTVEDNGRGFSPGENGRPGGGNGLANLASRLGRVGGTCQINSAPGAGATVRFRARIG
jgi:ligand-binding sensor domain-containing protein/signal transduction histidine kinase